MSYFSKEEFQCPCGCGEYAMDPLVITKLEVARQLLGRAITLASAVRCLVHNESVGGSPTSSHLVMLRQDKRQACAVDISVDDGNDCFDIISVLLRVGFTRIGVRSKGDRRFIHADLDTSKNQMVMWTYNEPTPA